jgi:hypothetical protein
MDTRQVGDQRSRERPGLSRTLWETGGSLFKTAALHHSATTPERWKGPPGQSLTQVRTR